jgi:hypothetical protein
MNDQSRDLAVDGNSTKEQITVCNHVKTLQQFPTVEAHS